MSEITKGVISMPLDLAMGSEISRRQFHSAAQELLAEREQLKAENEVLRPNAERYQWLRDKQTFIWLIQDWFPSDAEFTDVDAAIDTAMNKAVLP